MNNTSNTNIYIYKGEAMTITDLSSRYGIPRKTLAYRLGAGWGVHKSVTTPVIANSNQHIVQVLQAKESE